LDLTNHFHFAGWTERGERNKKILFNLDYSFQVKTTTIIGKDANAAWRFINGDIKQFIRISFKGYVQILNCMPEKIAIDIPKATKDIRIWTIEFYDRKLVIICNGKNFFEYKFSDSADNNCMLWRKKPTHIMFYKDEWVQDTESDQFRNNPKGLNIFICSVSNTTIPNFLAILGQQSNGS